MARNKYRLDELLVTRGLAPNRTKANAMIMSGIVSPFLECIEDKVPLVLGHEIAGEIADVGKNVSTFSIGDRVVATHHVPCLKCPDSQTAQVGKK